MVSVTTVGTSGWSYPEWKNTIYADVPQRRWLQRYTELFDAVEANITYRRDLSHETAARWLTATPGDFRFVIKAHQRATHFNRLKTPDADISLQVTQAELLGNRLGVVYFQLPHNFLRDDDLLAAFLEIWPSSIPAAWEFLHHSWDDDAVRELLRRHDVAWVVSDAKNPEPGFHATTSTAYVRLRGDAYDPASLDAVAAKIQSLEVDQVWVFVRHGADAPGLALQLSDRLS